MDLKSVLLFTLVGMIGVGPVQAAPGDITNDGKIDQADLKLLETYLQGDILLKDEQIEAADFDRDGRVNRGDASALKRRLEGLAAPTFPSDRLSAPKSPKVQPSLGLDSQSSGRVIDQRTGRPLAGVVVEVPEENIQVITDAEGRFTFPRTLPPGRIITVKAPSYTPFSLTTTTNQRQGESSLNFSLEPLNARTIVLDDRIRHLGDNDFGPDSANAGDFRLPAEGSEIRHSFQLAYLPDKDPYLKIGSLIGVDTPESARAGQTHLPPNVTYLDTPTSGLRVYLNGQQVKRLMVNGDNLVVPLPRQFLKVGSNEIVLATGSWSSLVRPGRNGINLFSAPTGGTYYYDDVELTNVLLVIPGREENSAFRSTP